MLIEQTGIKPWFHNYRAANSDYLHKKIDIINTRATNLGATRH